MDRKLARDRTLGEEVLKSYVRAVGQRQPKVAEQLLCALEELARSNPMCRVALDEAYLLIGKGRPCVRGRAARHAPKPKRGVVRAQRRRRQMRR